MNNEVNSFRIAEKQYSSEIADLVKKCRESMFDAIIDALETESDWKEFSRIASELHRRGIETTMLSGYTGIFLYDSMTGEKIHFDSLPEIKAFARGIDWGVKNAKDMAFRGLHSPICKETDYARTI